MTASRLLPRIALAAAIAAAAMWLALHRDNLDPAFIEKSIRDLGPWGLVGYVAVFAIATVLFLPGVVFGMAGGLLFGPLWGTILNLVGATLGATAAFLCWYLVCPRSYRRVTKLWLPRGGHQFWSRQAYRLDYGSQRDDAMGRAQRRMMKMHRAMGGDGSYDGFPPPKAKWRRWAKYDRQAALYDELSDRVGRAFKFQAMRVIAMHDSRMRRRRR